MKKKILCLILGIFLCVGSIGLFACKKNTGYAIEQFKTDYADIAKECSAIYFNTNENRLEFDYDVYEADGKHYLTEALQVEPYNNVENFNEIFYNSTKFISSSMNAISSKGYNVERALRDELQQKLEEFKVAILKVDLQTDELASQVHFNVTGDIQQGVYLQTLKYLLDSYNNLYFASYELTNTVSKIFFTYMRPNYNLDFSNTALADFNAEEVLAHLQSKIDYELSLLSYTYYQRNLASSDITEKIVTPSGDRNPTFGNMGEAFDAYHTKANAIGGEHKFDQSLAETINSDTVMKEQFLWASIEIYNVTTCLNNNFEMYYKASHEIDYITVLDAPNPTEYELSCMEIIDNYYYLTDQFFTALSKAVDIIY